MTNKQQPAARPKTIPASIIVAILLGTLFLLGIIFPKQDTGDGSRVPSSGSAAQDAQLTVYCIDVGQGDSTLIVTPENRVLLIDAGGRSAGQTVVNFLRGLNISRIDVLVATHPHEDHIGGMEHVISEFEIGDVYMPKIPEEQLPTSKTFESFLTALENKKLKLKTGKSGVTALKENCRDSSTVTVRFLAPAANAKQKDLNNYSIVTLITRRTAHGRGEQSMLIMGDVGTGVEKEILKQNPDLKAAVLRAGHHGSKNSTSKALLEAVEPLYAIMSCGADNDYGHPHEDTLAALSKRDIKIYRTDESGTVVIHLDGQNIEVSTI